jgi:hypothetical protein
MSCANWKSSPELCDACFFHKEELAWSLAWSQVLDLTVAAQVQSPWSSSVVVEVQRAVIMLTYRWVQMH